MPIQFGTDGWRAVIAEEYTFENVRHVAQAYSDVLHERGEAGKGIVVGYDTRFLSERFALAAAEVLAGNGVRVLLADAPVPTPAVSWAVRELATAGAVMITASHNPPEYNGFKIKAAYAGSALPELTAQVEGRLNENLERGRQPARAKGAAAVERVDLTAPYVAQLRRLVDLEAIRRARLRLAVDPMHGAGRGILRRLLEELGLEVLELHGDLNPGFGGIAPEPIRRNLAELMAAVPAGGWDLGVATDGDADRVGAVDEKGEMVDAQRCFALLLQHVVEEKRWQGSVVKTFAVTRMVDRLAERYGLRFHKRPVGFKYVCELALEEPVLIGGEESGGVGFPNAHIPERDGLLSGLMLAEMVAQRGRPLSRIVRELMETVGYHVYDRVDLHLPPGRREALMEELAQRPPRDFAGLAVSDVDPLDGYKYELGEHGWILIRLSGTEPIVRVYAELDDPERLRAVLEAGKRLALGA
ncbi:MAG: phosphoglucomutase/phosphomannomutase family protein [Bacillota bacterium]|nr:phosphoglucomutase/phosphomannomutase family protein [Bacillota bacterium]